jgi:hypothetical protein
MSGDTDITLDLRIPDLDPSARNGIPDRQSSGSASLAPSIAQSSQSVGSAYPAPSTRPYPHFQSHLTPYTSYHPFTFDSQPETPASVAISDDVYGALARGDSVGLEGSLWSPRQDSLAAVSVASNSPNLAAWGLPGQPGGLDVEYQLPDAGGVVRHTEATPGPIPGGGREHANDILCRRSAYEEAMPRSMPFLASQTRRL